MRLLTPALIALGLAFSSSALAQAPVPTVDPTAVSVSTGASTAAVSTAAAGTAASVLPTISAPQPARPVADVGQPIPQGYGLQPQVTKNGQFAQWMHNVILLPIITAISILVLGLLFWVAYRYRRSANPVPSKTSHNTLIEVIWTLVPVLILVGIAIPSIGLLAAQYKPVGKNAVTIKATGAQWYWTYNYPDHGDFEIVSNMLPDDVAKARGEPRLLAVDNRLIVPVGVPIRVLTTSNDVIHSFSMPAFWTKMDAVPGRINETSFTVEKAGVYYGQCSELCGARHGFMPIGIEAVSPAAFAQWIASKGGTMPGAKPAASVPVGMTTIPVVPAAVMPAPDPAKPASAPAAIAPANRATNSSALK